ncbi:TIGR01620 family protein [Paracoccus sp. Z330]|uniref:TIGR01620 family protein n=1 Tax=Paracoccus onchidii TaxID=3017813 RepID=A0ABT4ZBH7_9RHOB|nr:TIGR01620 family protein [Paracoccus onchidii]MDB6176721.1 TIGR01620 family protein [Paracoccus onchidii]
MSEPSRPNRRGPVLIEIDDGPGPAPKDGPQIDQRDDPGPSPADAPPVDRADPMMPRPHTMEMVTRLVGRPPSRLTRFFINSGVALFTFLLSIAALEFIDGLLNSYPVLGWIGIALFGLFTCAALAMAWREYRAWARFARIDAIQRQAGAALAEESIEQARKVCDQLQSLYRDRPELKWQRQRLADQQADVFDARSLMTLAETELLAQLDQQARREIEAAARSVAAATALIPLALADVAAALAANLRMIRRMAEIYGGRAGAVGGWRLARTVMTHLVATGAVAAGDDLIHTVAGGGIMAKLSRRFGEGIVNGALTARVGIAAMEVCRPLPFMAQPRPKVGNLVSRGLRGLFGDSSETTESSPTKG